MTRKLTTNQSGITEERVLRGSSRGSRTYVLLILEVSINNLSGTDGLRLRCRQFYTSSKSPHLPSRARFKKCYQKWTYRLLLRHSDSLAKAIFPLAFQRHSGMLFSQGLLIMSPTAQLRKTMVSQEKPYDGWYKPQKKSAN